MNQKPEKRWANRRGDALSAQKNDALSHLSFLGLNAQLAAELQCFYQASLSEPMPERVQELLERLSQKPENP